MTGPRTRFSHLSWLLQLVDFRLEVSPVEGHDLRRLDLQVVVVQAAHVHRVELRRGARGVKVWTPQVVQKWCFATRVPNW